MLLGLQCVFEGTFCDVSCCHCPSCGAVWTLWGSKTTTGTVTGNFTTTTRKAPYSSHHKAHGGSNGSRLVPLSESEVDGVEKFVLFIGHSKSGHSIISAMMDAHPNIVIAIEYHVLQACVPETPSSNLR